jgi:hypothetical protein
MNNIKYLRIRWSALLIRYEAIFTATGLVIIFAQQWSALFSFTLYYWIVCVILMALEKSGSYTEFNDTQIVQRYWFVKHIIPTTNVISMKDGNNMDIIGNPKSVAVEFKRDGGRRGVWHILRHQFKAEELKTFNDELLKRNPRIETRSTVGTTLKG